jgi:hypothetical protein
VKSAQSKILRISIEVTFGTTWFNPVLDSENRDRIKKELFGPILENEIVEMYQGGEFHTTH